MLAYSPDSESSRAYLLRQYNDIDIYVEDVSAQNAYVRLFSRILDGVARISTVFPLQNRQNVLKACAADQGPGGRRRVYIIDRDFDGVQGVLAPTLDRLYQLDVYCSENLLLSESAAIHVAMECASNRSKSDLRGSLRLRELFDSAVERLTPLFIAYAISEWLELGITTSGYHVQRLLDEEGRPKTLSSVRMRRRLREVRAAILGSIDIATYRALRTQFALRMGQDNLQRARHISGKTYLLPLLNLHLTREVGLRGDIDSLKVRLADKCELSIDPGLSSVLVASVS